MIDINERAFVPWYKDRDFPEVKSGNDDVVAVVQNPEQLQRIILSHNILLDELNQFRTDKIYYVEGSTGGIFDRITWEVAAFLNPVDAAAYAAALNHKVSELGLNIYSNDKRDHWNLLCELRKYDPRAHNDQDATEYLVYELGLPKFKPGQRLQVLAPEQERNKHSEADADRLFAERMKRWGKDIDE